MQKKNIKTIIVVALLILIASIAITYPLANKHTESSIEEQGNGIINVSSMPINIDQTKEIVDNISSLASVNIDMTKEGGVLRVPTDDGSVIEKNASAVFSGTINENNHVILEGTITLDGTEENVQLSGEAYQVFVGWNVPESAEPLYTKINGQTMTRYEGSTERYATYVDLKDKTEKYNLHGEFYDDGNGYFVGFVYLDEKQYQMGLIGNSMSMYENVTPSDD
jgi:hypothetical protein